ncbi:MAG: helix-turn-helix transcriptional regulator [Synergistaceae bacterium]|nr:helix-turn-helix transcriptional regulator [Synergistaceae bacterium]
MAEAFTPELLRSLRKSSGLTIKKLGTLVGRSSETISSYEKGEYKPPRNVWERIQSALAGRKPKLPPAPLQPPVLEPIPDPPSFTFAEGQCYSVRDSPNSAGFYAGGINPMSGACCIFRYEGKDGIHHCFRETRGGWRRTYTDAQLVGKIIEEVEK